MSLLRFASARAAPDITIRTIRAGDAERVRRILQSAFEDENRRMGLRDIRIPSIRPGLLDFYLGRTPEGSFVAEGKGGLFGFCLACRWGSVAWLGPIAVLPPAQSGGIGRRLIEASVSVLRKTGVTTLGVETMPRSYRNLQLYTRLGMRFGPMTFDLSRAFTKEDPAASLSTFTGSPAIALTVVHGQEDPATADVLEAVGRISSEVSPGLDYRGEARATMEGGLGPVMVGHLSGGGPVGFAIAHTVPYAKEEAPGTARVNTLLLTPPDREQSVPLLRGFLGALINRLGSGGSDAVIFRVPAVQPAALDALQEAEFKITHSDVRLTYPDLPVADRPGTIHLSKWE